MRKGNRRLTKDGTLIVGGRVRGKIHKGIEARTRGEPITAEPAPGRNDPCPCGSGRKFKRCCS